MRQTTYSQVINKLKKAKRGTLFFIEDFLSFGSAKAVGKALERLVKEGEIDRVAREIGRASCRERV